MEIVEVEQRIRSILEEIGLPSLPAGPDEPLVDHGFDSLMVVLSVAAFEKKFAVKIPADQVDEEAFSTIAKIAALLGRLGAR